MTSIRAHGGERLCGSGRQAGETYLECGLTLGGRPLEHFLVDLPLLIDKDEWGISAIGISTFQDEGVTHVLDWVGEEHYPEVADFIEEARLKGVSRKVGQHAPIEGLTSESRLWLIHPRARVVNADQLPTPQGFVCPCGHGHQSQEGCLGLAWHAPANDGAGKRKLAEGKHYAVKPALAGPLEHGLAVFMVVPITALTVIEHPDPNVQATREQKARNSGLPVFVAAE